MKFPNIFIIIILCWASMNPQNSFAKEEKYSYLITFFDATDNDYHLINVVGGSLKMEATSAIKAECRTKDGSSALIKAYPIKKISGTPYSLSFNIVLKDVGGPCQFEFSGGSLIVTLESGKTGERKLLLMAIDRFFRNREGAVGSEVVLSRSTNPNIMGSVLLESRKPVVRILP